MKKAIPPSQFESEVDTLFFTHLHDNERMHFEELIDSVKHNGFKFHTDLFFPEGFSALGWKGRTYVEIKYTLTYNAFEHIRILRDVIPAEDRLVIITLKKIDVNQFKFSQLGTRFNLEKDFISFDELEDKLKLPEDYQDSDDRKSTATENLDRAEKDKVDVAKPNKERNTISEAFKVFKNGNVCLVLGAGVSQSVNLPSWTSLLEALLIENPDNIFDKDDFPAIEVASYNSTIIMARLLLSQYDLHKDSTDLPKVIKIMHDALYTDYDTNSDSDLLRAIVAACDKKNSDNQRLVSSIITTNYDDIVEQKLDKAGIPYFQVIKEGKYMSGMLPIIHVHGSLNYEAPYPVLPTLSEESYHEMYRNGHSWANVELMHAFYRNTCIFIGMSMSDPNIRRLLENVKSENPNNIDHYAILPFRPLTNHNWDSAHPQKYYVAMEKKEQDFRNRQEKVFADLGIRVLWYEDHQYDQVAILLNAITGESPLPENHPLTKLNIQR